MTAISTVTTLNPSDQFKSYFSAIGYLFQSLCERTDTAFRRVQVNKTDETGNIKFYGSQSTISYIEHIESGDLYLDEPWYTVMWKCSLIMLGTPLYTLGAMGWHFFKIPFQAGAIVLKTLAAVGEEITRCRLFEATIAMRDGLAPIPHLVGESLFEVVKAPIFALGVEVAVFYGIFKPFHGRRMEAFIEAAWQNGRSYREDFRRIPERPGETCLEAFITDLQLHRPFFFAHCFQSRGNIHSPRIITLKQEAL